MSDARIRRRFRLPWRTRADIAREVDEELAFDLEMREQELRARGLSPEQARAEARRAFGDVEATRAYCRAQDERQERGERRALLLSGLGQDVRQALRAFRRSPGFTGVALLTLAVGIGASTALLGAVHGVLLEPLPYAEEGRVVRAWMRVAREGQEHAPVAAADFLDWREGAKSLQHLAAFWPTGTTLSGEREAEFVPALAVTSNLFEALGVRPLLGRGFLPEEDRPGAPAPVVVLTHGLWQRRFGADPSVLGRSVQLDGRPHTVVGVLPRGFLFPEGSPELFTPLDLNLTLSNPDRARKSHWLGVLGRMKPGVTVEGARAELQAVAARLEAAWPDSNSGHSVTVLPLRDALVREVRPALLLLLAAAGLLLLIACANVAHLVLARGVGRGRELAVRAALGAGRGRLVRLVMTEGVLLSLVGGALGVVLAHAATLALLRTWPQALPATGSAEVDGTVLALSVALSLACGLLLSVGPALSAAPSGDLAAPMREGARGTGGPSGRRLRGALVVLQVGLAVVLLVGAGLLVRSLRRVVDTPLGFRPEGVLTFGLLLQEGLEGDAAAVPRFVEALTARLAALPGVRAVGSTTGLPLTLSGRSGLRIQGRAQAEGELPFVGDITVSADALRTLGVPLLRGRAFEARDGADAPPVVLVSQSMVERFWPGEEPLGARVLLGPSASGPWATVVGVVGDVRQEDLTLPPLPTVYRHLPQSPELYQVVVVRADGSPEALREAVRAEVRALDPGRPLITPQTLEEVVSGSLARRRFAVGLAGAFAGAALLLAAAGVYAAIAYAVSARTRELGIRMALGASRRAVLALVLRQGLGAAAVGLGLGLAAAAALSGLLGGLLYGVPPLDPVTFAAVAAGLLAVALLACWGPALRATRVDPQVALRAE